MVRASETYGYPLGKAMQHRKSERHPKGCPLEKECVAGISEHALGDRIASSMGAARVVRIEIFHGEGYESNRFVNFTK